MSTRDSCPSVDAYGLDAESGFRTMSSEAERPVAADRRWEISQIRTARQAVGQAQGARPGRSHGAPEPVRRSPAGPARAAARLVCMHTASSKQGAPLCTVRCGRSILRGSQAIDLPVTSQRRHTSFRHLAASEQSHGAPWAMGHGCGSPCCGRVILSMLSKLSTMHHRSEPTSRRSFVLRGRFQCGEHLAPHAASPTDWRTDVAEA